MTTYLLYAACVVIWGSTWIMMRFQLGEVAPEASLSYRYFAAGWLVLICAAFAGKRVLLGARAHLWCMLQGALMFSVNYWITYIAAAYLTTGVVSVFFAGVSAATMLIVFVVFGRRPDWLPAIGAGLGVTGTALVFWPEVAGLPLDGPEVLSGLLLVVSVFLFATGGLVGARNMGAGLPRYANIGWAMVYGGIFMALITAARGKEFGFEFSASYIFSLIWLIVMGSGLVFALYFTVMERIGPERASYASVMFPLVALVISTFAEGYSWPALALIGVPLALIGNGLVLWQSARSPASADGTEEEAEAIEWPVNIVKRTEHGGGVARHKPEGALGP